MRAKKWKILKPSWLRPNFTISHLCRDLMFNSLLVQIKCDRIIMFYSKFIRPHILKADILVESIFLRFGLMWNISSLNYFNYWKSFIQKSQFHNLYTCVALKRITLFIKLQRYGRIERNGPINLIGAISDSQTMNFYRKSFNGSFHNKTKCQNYTSNLLVNGSPRAIANQRCFF